MSEHLPYDNLKIDNNIKIETVLETSDENEVGYILEVDIIFPPEIHEKLKEYPPAPEILTPEDSWMSEYQLSLINKNNIKTKSVKLVPHLMKHEKYCIHYRNLKYLISLGIKVEAVHNIVSFKQKQWLKPYIEFNTDMRTKARNEFEKDFF